MRKLQLITLLLGLTTLVGACASAQAKSTGDQAGLAVPPPPPHVVPITAEPIVEPVPEIPAPASTTPAPRPNRQAPNTAPRPGAESKPETKPGEAKLPEQPPPADAAPASPPGPTPQLRTADSNATEANVHAAIDRTRNLLSTVDYRHLSNARRKAYEDAKAFTQQAEDALKAGNVVFAQGVASKAETLARELAGR